LQLSGSFPPVFRRRAGGFLAAFLEEPSCNWCHVSNNILTRIPKERHPHAVSKPAENRRKTVRKRTKNGGGKGILKGREKDLFYRENNHNQLLQRINLFLELINSFKHSNSLY